MKKRIALFLSILMLMTMILPMQSFAAGEDQGLEKALIAVKSKITIPEGFTLRSSFNMENELKIWSLQWSSKDESDGGIYVRVNEKGTILSYDKWMQYNYERSKFPKVNRQQAKEKAEEFINKVNPGLLKSLKYQDNNQNSISDYSYYFNYVRLVNDIPYYNNNVGISVNRDTGEVLSYYYNWTDNLSFPAPKDVITLEDAQKAYKNNMGLKLVYMSARENEQLRIYAAYVPKYDNYNYAIDAFTGDRIELKDRYYYPYYSKGEMNDEKQALMNAAGDTGFGGVTLTPEEKEEIEKMAKLKPLNEIEKEIRAMAVLNLTDDMKLVNYDLNRNWTERDKYEYYLRFSNEAQIAGKDKLRYVNVTVDALKGEIKNFYSRIPYDEAKKPVDDQKAARAAVEKFLKEFKPKEFSQTEFDEEGWSNYLRYAGAEPQNEYSFYFARKVNGIIYQNNGISVGYDAVNQRVYNFNMEWYDGKFPSIDKAAVLEDVYKVVFGQVGLELQYRASYPKNEDAVDLRIPEYDNTKPEIELVYALKGDKPLYFDGYTGAILGYDGKPYKEIKPVEYTDISNSFAKNQIMALAEYGIALEGTEFMPGTKITQLDFFYLLSKTLGYYYGPIITKDSSDEEINNLYSYLIREGILTKEEKAPKASVKREDAVKYIIKALKFDEVAKIEGIYNCTFKDKDKISKGLIGHVTIAAGLKIIAGSDGNFNPQNELTRAETAVMIYNYLQR